MIFLDRIYTPIDKVSTAPKLVQHFKIPFCGPQSYKILNDLKRTLRKSFNHVDWFDVVLSTHTNVCAVGSTYRSFKARRLEHLGLSIHTGNPILRPEFSNIRTHSEKISSYGT